MYLIKGAKIVNEGRVLEQDVWVRQHRIEKIGHELEVAENHTEITAEGLFLFPGMIDDQVHFREPGLTHKANIFTESRAAVAGGVTSFMEMPNVIPQTITQELLQQKYEIGTRTSLANYSFYIGSTNDNLEEVLKTNPSNVCGIKIFMGSSTGNMLVDNTETLANIFRNAPILIATHCEDEATIRANQQKYEAQYGDAIPFRLHPIIRSEEACYLSSSKAVELAKQHNSRLHILHISTAKETSLFTNEIPLSKKRITAEVCVHHLWFSNQDYESKGALIKWNPAIKTVKDQDQLLSALLNDHIDIIATDHSPHTKKEKSNPYTKAPSGGPLIQHALVTILDLYHQGKISLEKIVEKMAHAPAQCFEVQDRGFIREGYFADIVLVDLDNPWIVANDNILAKCKWSPFEGHTFKSKVTHTFVSGHLAYEHGKLDDTLLGQRLIFDRQ